MSQQPIDEFAARLPRPVQRAVRTWGALVHERREAALQDFAKPDDLRRIAGAIKQHTLENLDRYLEQAEASLHEHGAKVHWATDGAEANQLVLSIMQRFGATRLVKSKSMVTEEIELVPFLEANGIEAVETDLGEFIVQIDHDHPSHVVGPIVHKNRRDVAASFARIGLGAYDDNPEVITRRARAHLRRKYLEAHVGLTGANFLVAESGRVVLVTNEGNARFCLAPVPVHIAIVGIEKIVPHDRDLAVFLNLLARSATGQRLSVYTEFISGPRGPDQPHGPEEMHVILLDNRRTEVLASDCQEILRCIRCGACMNVCPVYRQASGHAYRSIYPGPLGAVLSPLLAPQVLPARRPAACLQPVRCLQRGLPRGHPDPGPAAALAGSRATGSRHRWRRPVVGSVGRAGDATGLVADRDGARTRDQRDAAGPAAVWGARGVAGGTGTASLARRPLPQLVRPPHARAAGLRATAAGARGVTGSGGRGVMSNASRDAIFWRIRAAQRPPMVRTPYPVFSATDVATIPPEGDAWALFAERLTAVHGRVFTTVEALAAHLRSQGWRRGYCDPALREKVGDKLGSDFSVSYAFDRGAIDQYQFGITRAAGAIAETGSLVLNDATTSARLAALGPWVHVAVLKLARSLSRSCHGGRPARQRSQHHLGHGTVEDRRHRRRARARRPRAG